MSMQKHVRHLYRYDAKTGIFTWKNPRSPRVRFGEVAGKVDKLGYRRLSVYGRHYPASWVAWMYVTGKWTKNEMYHINSDPTDNRFSNLREATRSENCVNKKKYYKENSYGYRGVKINSSGRFSAAIMSKGKEEYLGVFDA